MTATPLHTFSNPDLATEAFTHKSFARPNNERLEWLGDALIGSEVSKLLYRTFPDLNEGGLSVARVALVNTKTMADIARHHQLDQHLKLGKTFKPKEKESDRLLASLLEAYIAAIYLDGGLHDSFISKLYAHHLNELQAKIKHEGVQSLRDAKSRLQEWLQKHKLFAPTYHLLDESIDASNSHTFIVECCATDKVRATGEAGTRAAAESQAAESCLQQLQK